MLNEKNFQQFHTEQEAYVWAVNYFGSWINNIQANKSNYDKNNIIANLMYAYTGNMNVVYNQFLRGVIEFDKEQIEKYSKEIAIITKEICKFELQEDIIVYRYTNKKLFKYLFKELQIKVGSTFIEKGFMSTTLMPGLMREFSKNHKCDCVLKLYLPKGSKGAYISFGENKLNEFEFLLPPNSTFKLLAKHFNIKNRTIMYECLLINQ